MRKAATCRVAKYYEGVDENDKEDGSDDKKEETEREMSSFFSSLNYLGQKTEKCYS